MKLCWWLFVYSLFETFTYLLTYLLTYTMQQSPSWEANRFLASQEITRFSWNPQVHYRVYKIPPPVPVLSQVNPVHVPYYFLKFHFNINLQSRGSCNRLVLRPVFTVRTCKHIAQPPSWRTTPSRLSATAYSVYSRLLFILEAVPSSATWGSAMPWSQEPT
jgi:hypothetical protein